MNPPPPPKVIAGEDPSSLLIPISSPDNKEGIFGQQQQQQQPTSSAVFGVDPLAIPTVPTPADYVTTLMANFCTASGVTAATETLAMQPPPPPPPSPAPLADHQPRLEDFYMAPPPPALASFITPSPSPSPLASIGGSSTMAASPAASFSPPGVVGGGKIEASSAAAAAATGYSLFPTTYPVTGVNDLYYPFPSQVQQPPALDMVNPLFCKLMNQTFF